MSGYTKGPWKAENSSVIQVESDRIVASCVLGCVIRQDNVEDYATARLIAAAPDLLEALKSIVACWMSDMPNTDMITHMGRHADKAVEAIAKAEAQS